MATTKPVVEFSEGVWEYVNSSTIQYIGIVDGKKTVLAKLTNLVNIAEGDADELTEGEKTFSYKKVNVINTSTNESAELDKEIDFTPEEKKEDEEVTSLVTSYSGVMTLKASILSTAKKPTLTQTKNYNFTMDVEADSKVQIAETGGEGSKTSSEHLVYDAKNGKITVVASLTAGYTVAKDGKSAEYFSFAPNVTLATITGLQKNFTDESTAELETEAADAGDTNNDGIAEGVITLSQLDTNAEEGAVGVLGTSAIKITNDKLATNNGFNYYLKLGGDYAQKDLYDESAKEYNYTPYWDLNKTTATYKVDTPTGYVYNTSGSSVAMDTQINVEKAFSTTIATVTGLAENLEAKDTDEDGYAESVGKTVDDTYTSYLTASVSPQPTLEKIGGKVKPTKDADGNVTDTGKGAVTVSVKDGALPTKGKVAVKAGANYDATTSTNGIEALNIALTTEKKALDPQTDTEFYENIWVIKGDTATYKKVQLAYYNIGTANEVSYVAQKDIMTLVTVKGLNADYFSDLTDEDNFTYGNAKDKSVITAIEGLEFTGKGPDAEYIDVNAGTDKAESWKWQKTSDVGTLTVSENLVAEKNITITKSDNALLVMGSYVDIPAFSNQKWNLSGTTATLKGDITAGYTTSDDGKTITYVKGGTNQTLATVSGLKKGTGIEVDASDNRKIGSFTGDDGAFVEGLVMGIGDLSHDGDGKLQKIDITVSNNVLDTSKVSIKSDFYKLAVDDEVKHQPDDTDQYYFTISGTTATYKKAESRPYYDLAEDGSSITYVKEKDAITLATVSGINKDTKYDLYDEDAENDISIDGDVITIGEGALGGAAIKVTKSTAKNVPTNEASRDYTLKLDEGITPSAMTWTQSGDKLSLNAKTGYKVNADGKSIAYTKDGGNTVLATISGLKPGIVDKVLETLNEELNEGETALTAVPVDDGKELAGVEFSETDGTITLSLEALNDKNVALTGSGNYKLALDSDIPKETTKDVESWVVSGTQAVYKSVNTSYYDASKLADKNSITFVAAKDATTANVLATIKGIKSGLILDPDFVEDPSENDDKSGTLGYLDDKGNYVAAIEINTIEKKVLITDSYALNGANVTLDAKNSAADYTIAIDTSNSNLVDEVMTAKLEEGTVAAWTVASNGTATYKGDIAGYYTNKDDNTIEYHKPTKAATIATITNLKSTAVLGDPNSTDGTIAIDAYMLNGKDVKLTTGVQLFNGANGPANYTLELGSDVTEFGDVENASHDGWVVSGRTATYGKFTPEYYELNAGTDNEGNDLPADTITYHAEGFNVELAKLSGLKKDLVTVQNDALEEIEITEGDTTFTLTGDAIVEGEDVTLENLGEETYSLATGEGITESKENSDYFCEASGGDTTDVQIYGAKTAGYTIQDAVAANPDAKPPVEATPLTLAYNDFTKGTTNFGKIIGLKKGLTADAEGKIDGIEVDVKEKTVTLSEKVLDTSTIIYGPEGSGFVLSLAEGIKGPDTRGTGFVLNDDGVLAVYTGFEVPGYTLEGNNTITYKGGGNTNGSTAAVTIKGLKVSALQSGGSALAKNTVVNNVEGIKVENNTVTLSQSVLGTDTVEFATGDDTYTFELDDAVTLTEDPTAKWSFSNGTATYIQAVKEGYKLEDDSTKVTYTPEKTITSTLNNLSKDSGVITAAEDGSTITGITFEDGVFTFDDKDILAGKTVSLTTRSSAKNDSVKYAIKLDSGIAAEKEDLVWNKTEKDTKATLTQVTKSGYSLSSDAQKINYSSDPTTETLATISGLKKEVAATAVENPKGDGTDYATTLAGLSVSKEPDGENPGEITISKGVLTTTDVKLDAKNNYVFELDTTGGSAVPGKATEEKNVWESSGTKATYKKVDPAYYHFKNTGTTESPVYDTRTIIYEKPSTGTTLFTINGLNKDAITPDVDGNIAGIKVEGTTVTLDHTVLGTSNITISEGYTLAFDSDDKAIIQTANEDAWKGVTEWVGNGTTYTYKKYDKVNYELKDNQIIYHKDVTNNNDVYATITNLKSGLIDVGDVDFISASTAADVAKAIAENAAKAIGFDPTDDDDPSAGGTITLGSTHLNEKQVKLTTKGEFTLKLDTTDTDLTVSKPDANATWSTSGTTATLKGTIAKGYAVNEDANIINYYNADKANQTLVTISGLSSGATIDADEDVELDSTTGITTVTLKKDEQLGTSKVTIKGDFYKLDVDKPATTDDPKWVKAPNATKATYTQTTYKGFTVADGGKTLNYSGKTTNVDLATLNGVSKELTVDQMTDDTADTADTDALVTLTTAEGGAGTITVKKAALNAGNVTLGNKDEFNLVLDATEAGAGDFTPNKEVKDHLTFKNGTASIVQGKTEGWTRTNGKLLTYTKPTEYVVSTISNLPKNLTYDSTTSSITGIGFTAAGSLGAADSLASITLGKTVLESIGKSVVTLKNNSDPAKNTYGTYKLVIDSSSADSVAGPSADANSEEWVLNGTNITVKSVATGGYEVTDNGTKAKYTDATDKGNLVTITGLPKGLKQSGESIIGTAGGVDYKAVYFASASDDKKIELSSSLTSGINTKTEIEVKGDGYTLSNAGLTTIPSGNRMLITSAVSLKGTATVEQNVPATWGFDNASSITKATYTLGETKSFITISGLNKNAGELDANDINLGGHGNADSLNITVGADALTTTNVTYTKGKAATTLDAYKFVLGSDVVSSVNGTEASWSVHGSGWKDQTEWVTSGGTATYKLYDRANYRLKADNKNGADSVIEYVKPTNGTAFAAISGMSKTASLGLDKGVSWDAGTGGTISLGADELTGISKVQLKITPAKNASSLAAIDKGNSIAGGFNLAIDDALSASLSTAKNAAWDTNNGTAKLTGTITKGYALSTDKMTITYNKDDKTGQTIAQVTGLDKNSEIKATEDISTNQENGVTVTTITLTDDHLATSNVAVKGDGYKLALAPSVVGANGDADSVKWHDQTEWVASGGTFTYKTYDKEYYELDPTKSGTAVIYHKAADDTKTNANHKTFVTISGLNKTISGSVSTDSIAAATSGEAATGLTQANNGVITLKDAVLNKAKVTLKDTQGDGYTLALDDGADKSAVSEKAAAISGTKVTWTGTKGIGYAVANDAQSIEYFSADKTKQTVAQVTGAAASATSVTGAAETFTGKYNEETNAVTFSDGDLSTVVGISGTAEFNFGSYANGLITGSSAADKVSIGGSSVSINAGGGNDYVDFKDASNSTFIYAVGGNGNDVIANFGSNKIQITGNISAASIISAAANNGDAVVNVNKKGTIRLKGLASSVGSLNIVDKNGDAISYSGKTVTANVLADDNFETTPQLSSIVKGSASTYSAEDLVATDATSLTKKSSAIAYSGSSKK